MGKRRKERADTSEENKSGPVANEEKAPKQLSLQLIYLPLYLKFGRVFLFVVDGKLAYHITKKKVWRMSR
jgi:hypothetical protein